MLRAWASANATARFEPERWQGFWRAWRPVPIQADAVTIVLPLGADERTRAAGEGATDEGTATRSVYIELADIVGSAVGVRGSEVSCRDLESDDGFEAVAVAGGIDVREVPTSARRLRLWSDDLAVVEVDVPAAAAGDTTAVTAIVTASARVEVRLVPPEGLADDDIELRLEPPRGTDVDGETRDDPDRALRRVGDGRWRAERLAPGHYELSVDVLGTCWDLAVPVVVDLAPGTSRVVTVRLARTGS